MDIKIIVDETVLAEAMALFINAKFSLPLTTEVRIDLGSDGILATIKLED